MTTKAAPQPDDQPRIGNALPCLECNATGWVRLHGLPGKRSCSHCGGTGWVLQDEQPEIRGT
jgi:DnaJ-class molecular chaperone